jgi:hypothetical protein
MNNNELGYFIGSGTAYFGLENINKINTMPTEIKKLIAHIIITVKPENIINMDSDEFKLLWVKNYFFELCRNVGINRKSIKYLQLKSKPILKDKWSVPALRKLVIEYKKG